MLKFKNFKFRKWKPLSEPCGGFRSLFGILRRGAPRYNWLRRKRDFRRLPLILVVVSILGEIGCRIVGDFQAMEYARAMLTKPFF